MAIVQVSVKTTEVETQRLGYTGISLTNMLNSTEPLVASGSVIEVGGSLYEFNSNTDIDPAGGLSGISNGNMVWMYINASTLSSVVTTTEPIWSEEKQAWYDSTETYRYYACMFKNSSGNYTNKQILGGRFWKPEIFISDNYTVSDEFINMKILADISANKTITLPTLADNMGKKIKIENLQTTYTVTVDGESSETIEGELTWVVAGGWKTFEGRSGDWKIIEDGGKKTSIRVYKDDAQSIPDVSDTKVQYDDEEYDELNEYDNTTNYRFTAKEKGKYSFNASLLSALASFPTGSIWTLSIWKNGTKEAEFFRETINATQTTRAHSLGSTTIELDAGGYVEIYCYHSRGGSTNTFASRIYDYISIERIR